MAWKKVKCASTGGLFRFLYRGTKFSGPNAVINNVCVFNSYTFAKHEAGLSTIESGCLAGISATPSAFFLDGCNIIKQVKGSNAVISPRSMLLRHGLLTTGVREIVGLSAHFSAYEYSREKLGMNPLFAGGCAGLSNWTASYPIDVVRTRQIVWNASAWYVIRNLDLRAAIAAYPACAIRAIAANASVFWAYEAVQSLAIKQ